jgi:hypothetical protein
MIGLRADFNVVFGVHFWSVSGPELPSFIGILCASRAVFGPFLDGFWTVLFCSFLVHFWNRNLGHFRTAVYLGSTFEPLPGLAY